MIISVDQNKASLQRIVDIFKEITKFRLLASVVISSIAGYLVGITDFSSVNVKILIMLSVGGYCMVGASNILNQIIERKSDLLMERTKKRVIPAGKLSVIQALLIAFSLLLFGLYVLYSINFLTAFFAFLSVVIYACIYEMINIKKSIDITFLL